MLRATRVLRSIQHNFIGRPNIYDQALIYEKVSDFGKKTPENNFGELKHWSKPEIDEAVLDLLYDFARVPADKVTMESNILDDLLVDSQYRFGFQDDLQQKFQFRIPDARMYARDLQSGREASDWVASILEEFGRLKC